VVLRVVAGLAILLLSMAIGALVGDERGEAIGWLAFAAFLPLFWAEVFRWKDLVRWADEHPVTDWAWMSVLCFVAVALVVYELPLAACAVAGMALATLISLVLRPRQRRAAD
jgi:hypothetical protein